MRGIEYIKAYWHYRRKAKGRHGVHSPFVYAFIEGALKPPASRYRRLPWPYKQADGAVKDWKPSLLLRRIVHYFDFSEIVYYDRLWVKDGGVSGNEGLAQATSAPFRRLVFYTEETLAGGDFAELVKSLGENDVVLYNRPTWEDNGMAWKTISRKEQVTLSIDLFEIGLLFFSKDFKVPQEFMLRYPL
jgi:hypothetical protein